MGNVGTVPHLQKKGGGLGLDELQHPIFILADSVPDRKRSTKSIEVMVLRWVSDVEFLHV